MKTRNRSQAGSITRIGSHWYVRHTERRNVGGVIQRKKVSHKLGPVTTRGKHPPANIVDEAAQYMATVAGNKMPADHVITMTDFAETVYLPWVEQHQRPSTLRGYKQAWFQHLKHARDKNQKTECGKNWLKDVRTYDVQGWLNAIAKDLPRPRLNSDTYHTDAQAKDGARLSRNSLKRIQSILSGLFSLAKQQGYFDGANPVENTRVDPTAPEAAETHAYDLGEIKQLLDLLPEPAATAFAVAAFMGLRIGELEGLMWENYHDGEMCISRSIWNGHIGKPKTRKSAAPVPVIRQLGERLELLRLRCQNPQTGPIFRNSLGNPLSMKNVLTRVILPVLNRCAHCGLSKGRPHVKADHVYQRDPRLPEWHGWHAARRGLGTNLYRLGVPDVVIQRILRHGDVSTTVGYYIKPTSTDVRSAMKNFELVVPENQLSELRDTFGTVKSLPSALPESIN